MQKTEKSNSYQRRKARQRRAQERRWADKSSAAVTTYQCVCERNPDACRVHARTNDQA